MAVQWRHIRRPRRHINLTLKSGTYCTCQFAKFIFPFSNIRRELDENRALLSCYAASGGNSLPTFRYNL
jgi:hypothetical protein